MNKFIAITIVMITLTLSSCVNLLPKVDAKIQRIDFTEYKQTTQTVKVSSSIVKVAKPTCGEHLNTIRINFYEQHDNIKYADYLADIEWQDPLPLLIQDHLGRLLRNSGQFKAVALAQDKFHADYILQTHIQHFSITKQQNNLQAKIELTVTLLRNQDQAIIAQRTFKHCKNITSESMVNFIQTLDQTFLDIQQDIMAWIQTSTL